MGRGERAGSRHQPASQGRAVVVETPGPARTCATRTASSGVLRRVGPQAAAASSSFPFLLVVDRDGAPLPTLVFSSPLLPLQSQAPYQQSPYPSSFSYHPSSRPAYASIHSYNSAASNNSFEPPSPQNNASARSFLAEYTASPFNVPSVLTPINSNSSSNAASSIPSSGLLPLNVPSLQIPTFPHQQEQQRYNDQQYNQQPSYQSYQTSHPAPSNLNRTSSTSPQRSNLNDLGLPEPDAPPYPSFPAQQQPLSQRYGDSPTTDLEDLVFRRQPLPTHGGGGDNDDYQPPGERSSIDTASSSSRPNTTENEGGLVEGGEPMILGAGEEATADEDDGGKGKGADCTAFISKVRRTSSPITFFDHVRGEDDADETLRFDRTALASPDSS
jgi:hypothetical protein